MRDHQYLFYADTLGWIPVGNDGMMMVPPGIRSRRALLNLAESWLGNRAGRVYLMNYWTQAMCELAPQAFDEYIAKHGELLARSHYAE